MILDVLMGYDDGIWFHGICFHEISWDDQNAISVGRNRQNGAPSVEMQMFRPREGVELTNQHGDFNIPT